ncbi:MAG: hypothetical protein HQK54_03350 [Oligoflexales bacterium]|nr:hypothetical protein [Oligoflexales bacterium]
MTLTKKTTRIQKGISHDGMPTIRKVFRHSNVFICSICKEEHKSLHDARKCLADCWEKLMEMDVLVKRRHGQEGEFFRCRFCCRDYKEFEDGLRCVEECGERKNKVIQKEQIVMNLSSDFVKPFDLSQLKISELKKHFQAKFQLKRKETLDQHTQKPEDDISTGKGKNTKDQKEQKPDATEDTKTEVKAKRQGRLRKKSEFPTHWFRSDAKYGCRYCQKMYFTRSEVEFCFHSHFDDNDIEKPEEK